MCAQLKWKLISLKATGVDEAKHGQPGYTQTHTVLESVHACWLFVAPSLIGECLHSAFPFASQEAMMQLFAADSVTAISGRHTEFANRVRALRWIFGSRPRQEVPQKGNSKFVIPWLGAIENIRWWTKVCLKLKNFKKSAILNFDIPYTNYYIFWTFLYRSNQSSMEF